MIYLSTCAHISIFLCICVQATLVRNTTDENEARILYEYLAEASVVFQKVFPVMYVSVVSLTNRLALQLNFLIFLLVFIDIYRGQ